MTNVNIATTRAIRCAATSGLAYRHLAHITAAVLGFLRCHSRWKIFSIFFANSLYYQCAIGDGSTVVGGANNLPCCAPGGPVSTWTVRRNCPDKIVLPVGFQRESEHIRPVHVNGLTPTGPARAENR